MKIIIDRQSLQRRARLAHSASLGGLLILLGGVAFSLWKPSLTYVTAILLFLGGTLAMVGIYFANRWVRKPRPEDVLDQAFKGLSDQYCLYHYVLPSDHVLLTPQNLMVIETVGLEGVFTYQNGCWQQKMSMGRAMRYFVEEKLGDPTSRARAGSAALKTRLLEALPEGVRFEVTPLVVFTNPMVELHVEKPPIAVCVPKKLRAQLPKNQPKMPEALYRQIRGELDRLAGNVRSQEEAEQESAA